MAHKVEHAVDFSSGALAGVTLQPADAGDTATGRETVCEAGEQIATVGGGEKGGTVNPQGPKEVVLDKGYHSNEVLTELADWKVRTYCSEPDRGRRHWEGKMAEQAAVYANRRRIRGERGKRLLRQRGEKVERSFAHCYEKGRDATRASAASPEYSQASAGARGSAQLGTGYAPALRPWNDAGPARLRCRALFNYFAVAASHLRSPRGLERACRPSRTAPLAP